jgi:hypothetical protein
MQRKITGVVLLAILTVLAPQVPAQRTKGGEIHGTVTDEQGSAIFGAAVTLVSRSGQEKTAQTDQQGAYSLKLLAADAYTMRVSAKGFGPYENTDLQISSTQSQALDIQLKVAFVVEKVTVASNQTINSEPDNNADALVLRGTQLEILPDDADDLASALQALAGPAAGPSGGEIFVDGFSGARLPLKSSIREVRINQNPFSAEFDRVGFGRIEILTKPGSGEFQGEAQFNFNDESLNARNPFATTRAPYQVRSLDFSITGPIIKNRASFSFDLEYRGLDDNAYINALVLDSSLNVVPFIQTVLTPRRSQERQPRIDWQINKNNTLIVVFEFNPSHAPRAGIGGFTLPSRAYETTGYERQFRVTETAVLSPHTVTETRLQVRYDRGEQKVAIVAPALNVQDSFNGGGDQSGPSLNKRHFFALYNNTTLTHGSHVLRFGGRVRHVQIDDASRANFGGTFTFAGGNAVILNANNEVVRDPAGNPLFDQISSIERYRRTLLFSKPSGVPKPPGVTDQDLGTGPAQFSITTGSPQVSIAQTDISGYLQDQWNIRPNFTLNFGLRYEWQNNIQSNLNFAPRAALAWSPGAKSGAPSKSVVRLGGGIFYERVNENLTLQEARFNGINQQQYVVTDPAILANFPVVPTPTILSGFALPQTIRRKASDLRTPYLIQLAGGYERQLPFKATASVMYVHSRSLHTLRSRNVNAPLPGTYIEGMPNSGVRPFGNTGNIIEFESSGVFNQNQLILTFDNRLSKKLALHGTYALSSARGDTDGVGTFPSNTYDLSNEYGRSSVDVRHRVTVEGTVLAPWGLRLTPFFIVSSGRPFNIVIGRDANGDAFFTERPAFATGQTKPGDLLVTEWGRFDLNPNAGTPPIPRNFGSGPMFASMNLRVSKTMSVNEMMGLFQGNRPRPGKKDESPYKMTFSLQAQNLLNRTNRDLPVGNASSPFFGQSTATLGGYGEGNRSSAGNRRITAQIKLEF